MSSQGLAEGDSTVERAPLIRTARVADAPELSAFAARCFRETFQQENDPADLESYVAGAFNADRQLAEITDSSSVVLLAEVLDAVHGPRLAGYAHVVRGVAPAEVAGPDPIELKRLYVGSEWHGRGVARSLMEAVLQTARTRGARTLWLGVWERNARAIAFYRKHGFERVGEQTFLMGRDLQLDWLMSLLVSP